MFINIVNLRVQSRLLGVMFFFESDLTGSATTNFKELAKVLAVLGNFPRVALSTDILHVCFLLYNHYLNLMLLNQISFKDRDNVERVNVLLPGDPDCFFFNIYEYFL